MAVESLTPGIKGSGRPADVRRHPDLLSTSLIIHLYYRCIDGLTSFAQPVLDIIAEYTGMRAFLLVGGPEPAAQQMNILG